MKIKTCGTATKKFKDGVKVELDKWFGGEDKYTILFIWYQDETAMATVTAQVSGSHDDYEDEAPEKTIYFLRLFEICSIMTISQDHKEKL